MYNTLVISIGILKLYLIPDIFQAVAEYYNNSIYYIKLKGVKNQSVEYEITFHMNFAQYIFEFFEPFVLLLYYALIRACSC